MKDAARPLYEFQVRGRGGAAVNNEEGFHGKIFAKMFHVKHLRVPFAVKRCTKISLDPGGSKDRRL
jgi:hypothetical protein